MSYLKHLGITIDKKPHKKHMVHKPSKAKKGVGILRKLQYFIPRPAFIHNKLIIYSYIPNMVTKLM